MSGFLSRLLYRAGIANAAGEEISLLNYRSPARFEPSEPEPATMLEGVESNSATPASSVVATGVGEFRAASDATPAKAPGAQPGIRASLDVKAPAVPSGRPVRVHESAIDFEATPGRSKVTTASIDDPILMQDHRSRFERHSREMPAAPASITLPPTLPPEAPGGAGERPLTPNPQPARRHEVLPEDLQRSNVPEPSVPAPGIRRIEAPPASSAPSSRQTEPQPETIIQIDRVEIVASKSEPRRAVAPVSRKPTTSLADYLARRRR